jgi:Trypsin-like peptidase domain
MRDQMEAVIRVGDGRGFILAGEEPYSYKRNVITAAHCLLKLPPCDKASCLSERTYPNLLGPLGEAPTVWAECLFADPVADIAVLGTPDNQTLYEQAEAYDLLVESVTPLRIAKPTLKGMMLSLKGEWYECDLDWHHGPLFSQAETEGGMSGSPILNPDGEAIGVVGNTGLHACWAHDLPARMLMPTTSASAARSAAIIEARAKAKLAAVKAFLGSSTNLEPVLRKTLEHMLKESGLEGK